MKNNFLKKLIEQAIQNCQSSDLNSTKNFLNNALKEIKKLEFKENSKKNNQIAQWKFDINTSSLVNLSQQQKTNIIKNINNLIQIENKKSKNSKNKEDVILE